MDSVIKVKDLSIGFRLLNHSFRALHNVSFQVPKNKTVALVGESGSGKTLSCLAMMGLLPKNAHIIKGDILFFDQEKIINLAKLKRDGKEICRLRGSRISMIFQEPMTALSPMHRIGDQIMEAVKLHRDGSKSERLALIKHMLKHVGFEDPLRAMRSYTFELSGGMRQRAMIAQALICHPSLLIADEPTTALDVSIQAQILKLLKDLQTDLQMSILFVTHDLGIVAHMADEVVVLYHGHVVEKGNTEDLFETPQHEYLKGLFRAVPRLNITQDILLPLRQIHSHTGKLFADDVKKHHIDTHKNTPIIRVENLSKVFAKKHALRDVSFSILRGECLGVVGESGCGKTTLSKLIMQSFRPDHGRIYYHDVAQKPQDIYALKKDQLIEYKRHVQYIFQDPQSALNPRMRIYDILREPLDIHRIKDPDIVETTIHELIHLVGLDQNALYHYPHNFSGGQRQRIVIARALALHPDLIICDEPVSALDVSIQAQILNLLKDLKERLGLTYMFITHNLAVVKYIADRVMVMRQGQIVELAPTKALFQNPRHPYSKMLLASVPEPDIHHEFDINMLNASPQNWPDIYQADQQNLQEIAPNHFVRMAV